MSKGKGKNIRFFARIVSHALVLAMLTESFLGSGSSLSGVSSESYVLEYADASWTDRLTKVTYTKNGSTTSGNITYDQIGNPLTYFNGQKMWNFTWKFGRQLTNASSGSAVVSYTYDVDGIRQSKTVNGNTTRYTTLDGKVVRETNGNVKIDYFYDNEGKPYKFVVKNNIGSYVGYYVLNQQGDVIAILDDTGSVAVRYEYNAWGRVVDETGTGTVLSTYLQSYNRLKYRGYYHDAETGFYYLILDVNAKRITFIQNLKVKMVYSCMGKGFFHTAVFLIRNFVSII